MSDIILQAIKECVNEYTEMIIDEYHLRTDLQIASIKRVEQKVLAKMAKDFIDQRPTVDVAEVVRCKDCVHYTPCEGGLSLCCYHRRAAGEQDFCSDGERKEKKV